MRHRNANKIQEIIKSNGDTSTDEWSIRGEAIMFFSTMLGQEEPWNNEASEHLLQNIPRLVLMDVNEALLRPFSEEEVKEVAFRLNGDKSSGLDGFPTIFF